MANEFDTPLTGVQQQGVAAADVRADTSGATALKGLGQFVKNVSNVRDIAFVESAAEGASAIFDQAPAEDPATEGLPENDVKEINSIRRKVEGIQRGARQGKFNDVIRTEAFVKQQIAKRPDLAKRIRSAVQNTLGVNPANTVDKAIKLQDRVVEKELDAAASAGAPVFDANGNVDVEATRLAGRQILQSKAAIENAEANRSLSVNESTDKLIQENFKQLKPRLTSLMQMASRTVDAGAPTGQDGKRINSAEDLIAQASRSKALYISELRRSAAVGGHPTEAIDTAVDQVSSAFDDVIEYLSVDQTMLKQRLDNMKTANDLTVEESVGLTVALTRAMGDSFANSVSGQLVISNKTDGAAKLAAENLATGIQGLLGSQASGRNKLADGEAIATIAGGQGSVADVSKARRPMVTKGLARIVKDGPLLPLDDPREANSFNNASRAVMDEVSASGDLSDITSAANMFNNAWRSKLRGSVLTKPDLETDATLRSLASFSQNAAPRIARSLQQQVNSSDFFKLKFNPNKGVELALDKEAVEQRRKIAERSARTSRFPLPEALAQPVADATTFFTTPSKPPKAMEDSVKAFNNLLENFVFTKEYDTFLQGMDDRQIRETVARFLPDVARQLGARPEQQPDAEGNLRTPAFREGVGTFGE